METSTLFSTPGRPPSAFPWRAPGDVDRAGSGPAARRLFVASPLHEACRLGDAQAVAARLEAGVDVDELDGGDHTPLHYAAGYDQPEVVSLLLSRGAALEKRDKWGKAPVDWAMQSKSKACIKLMRAEAIARGVEGGKGKVAPLRTMIEHFHDCTDEEMEVFIAESNRALNEKMDSQYERKQSREKNSVRSTTFSVPRGEAGTFTMDPAFKARLQAFVAEAEAKRADAQ